MVEWRQYVGAMIVFTVLALTIGAFAGRYAWAPSAPDGNCHGWMVSLEMAAAGNYSPAGAFAAGEPAGALLVCHDDKPGDAVLTVGTNTYPMERTPTDGGYAVLAYVIVTDLPPGKHTARYTIGGETVAVYRFDV